MDGGESLVLRVGRLADRPDHQVAAPDPRHQRGEAGQSLCYSRQGQTTTGLSKDDGQELTALSPRFSTRQCRYAVCPAEVTRVLLSMGTKLGGAAVVASSSSSFSSRWRTERRGRPEAARNKDQIGYGRVAPAQYPPSWHSRLQI